MNLFFTNCNEKIFCSVANAYSLYRYVVRWYDSLETYYWDLAIKSTILIKRGGTVMFSASCLTFEWSLHSPHKCLGSCYYTKMCDAMSNLVG